MDFQNLGYFGVRLFIAGGFFFFFALGAAVLLYQQRQEDAAREALDALRVADALRLQVRQQANAEASRLREQQAKVEMTRRKVAEDRWEDAMMNRRRG